MQKASRVLAVRAGGRPLLALWPLGLKHMRLIGEDIPEQPVQGMAITDVSVN